MVLPRVADAHRNLERLVYEADTGVEPRGRRVGTHEERRERSMPIWAWILIILLIVFLLGGFGYRRRGR